MRSRGILHWCHYSASLLVNSILVYLNLSYISIQMMMTHEGSVIICVCSHTINGLVFHLDFVYNKDTSVFR